MVVTGPYVVETGSSEGSGQATSVHRVQTGALVWQRLGAACYGYGLAVAVVGQQVVSHTCDEDTGAVSLTAYRLTNGALSWTRAIDWTIQRGRQRRRRRAPPAGQGRLRLHRRPRSGTGVTQYYDVDASSVLAVDATRGYGRCGTSVCAFGLTTGDTLWSTADASTVAAEAGGVLYLGDGRMLDAATGAALGRAVHHRVGVDPVRGGRPARCGDRSPDPRPVRTRRFLTVPRSRDPPAGQDRAEPVRDS